MKENQFKKPLINVVAKKAIETIDITNWLPGDKDIVHFDLLPFLYKELILKELEFRIALQEIDWSIYEQKYVRIHCSNQSIIPIWAFMLVASYLAPHAAFAAYADKITEFNNLLLRDKINHIEVEYYKDKRIVIKGCSEKNIDIEIYTLLTQKLVHISRTISYGEPCSMVPIYKKSADDTVL
jgi:Protein of unknown function (DUF2480)